MKRTLLIALFASLYLAPNAWSQGLIDWRETAVTAAGLKITAGAVPFRPVRKISLSEDGIMVVTDKGRSYRLTLEGPGKARLTPQTLIPLVQKPPGQALPDGEVTVGQRNIARTWLFGPTDRYDHGVLGDGIEASGIRVVLRDLMAVQMTLPEDSVFEDRYPRLADVNGDGQDEIILVRSYLNRGAALAVLKADRTGVNIIAQTPPIGQPHRWLNPIGVGDFDGDGKAEFAYVETPHMGGTLMVYGLESGGVRLKYKAKDFSNHVMGSRELGMSAILDVTADGVPDLLVPGQDRASLRVVSFAGGTFKELAKIRLVSPISTALAVTGHDVVFGLEDGTLMVVRF